MTISASAPTDVGQLIDDGAWSGFQKLVLVLAALGFLTDGIANQTLGLAVPSLMKDWHLPREALASVTAIGLVGLTIGALFGGMLGDRVGRRPMMIVSTLLFGIMTVAASTAQDVNALFWMRFVDGLGIGAMIPNGASLISEFTPGRRRSMAIALGMVFIAIGSVLAGSVATQVLPTYGWRTLFQILGALPVALAVLFLLLLPESPLYLVRRGDRRGPLVSTLRRCRLEASDDAVLTGRAEAAPPSGWLKLLFNGQIRGTTLALWTGFFFCLLASYAMFSWVPAMLASLGFPLSMTSLGITCFSAGGVVGGVSSGWLIERFGLKGASLGLAAGGIAGALLLGGLIYGDARNLTSLFAALVVEGFFISGLHNGFYTIAAYAYPDSGRASGVGAAAAVGRVGAIASSYVGLIALQLGGASGYFLLIASALAASLLAISLIRSGINVAPAPKAAPAPAT